MTGNPEVTLCDPKTHPFGTNQVNVSLMTDTLGISNDTDLFLEQSRDTRQIVQAFAGNLEAEVYGYRLSVRISN